MPVAGWRIIVISSKSSVRAEKSCVLITRNDETDRIPLEQIKMIVFDSGSISFSVGTIAELCKSGIKLIFCDEKHNPLSEMIILKNNTYSSGRLFEQINWEGRHKNAVWKRIVELKILNQYSVAAQVDKKRASKLLEILALLEEQNSNEAEARAAKVYFKILFGAGFNRRTENNINSALNYGYAILMSLINRAVVIHGYNMAIGINHHSIRNPFNLSCDLIEPFRPIVDSYVYINRERELDFEYRCEMIELMTHKIIYNKRNIEVQNAVEVFMEDVFKELSGKEFKHDIFSAPVLFL